MGIGLPVVLAAALVWLTGNLLFAAMTALSPVLALGSWWSGRRASTRSNRREEARYRHELAALRTTVRSASAVEADRRRALLPHAAEVVRRAMQPSTRLWERRPEHRDAFVLSAGRADLAWSPALIPSHRPTTTAVEADVAAIIRVEARLSSCPVQVDLRDGGVVGIVGPAPAARAVARSLLLQAAVHHGPADLRVAVIADADTGAEWRWSGWLPHAGGHGGRHAGGVALGDGAALLDGMLAAQRDRLEAGRRTRNADVAGAAAGRTPTSFVVLDDEALLAAPRSPARAVLRGEAGPVAGVVIASAHDRLPATCTTVVELDGDGGEATVHDLRSGEVAADVVVEAVSEPLARTCARRLARFGDPDADEEGAGLPERVGLGDVLPADTGSVEGMARRWRAAGAADGLAVPIGMAADGPFRLDLVGDGPHAWWRARRVRAESELTFNAGGTWVATSPSSLASRITSIATAPCSIGVTAMPRRRPPVGRQ